MKDVKERFLSKIFYDFNGCWRWVNSLDDEGYGRFYIKSDTYPAHRFSYILHVGEIPKELELDHLCRNRDCVNPKHLEPVTHAENMRRAKFYNKQKTHCVRGHEFTESNTKVNNQGKRICLKCKRPTGIEGQGAINKNKTHCKRGHPFNSENTITNGKQRRCKICRNYFNKLRYK